MLLMTRRRHRSLVCLALALAGVGASAVIQAPAHAAAPGPHDPIGAASAPASVTGGLRFTGWAVDPDAPKSNVAIAVITDGRTTTASGPTSVANATITTKYGAGPTPGFVITTPVATGAHTVCVVAYNISAGLSTILRCVTTPLTTALTAAQTAAHSPHGALYTASATSTSFRVTGWASDPDWVARPSTVVLYIDGAAGGHGQHVDLSRAAAGRRRLPLGL